MSSEAIAIRVGNLSKCYAIYNTPRDRLKQFVVPRLQRLAGKTPKQYFREFWALKDVSFEVRKGETVGIIGRNGSGKSTLLQIICGTLHPSAGNIEVNGRVAALLELGSGFSPEFTGRENVYMNAGIMGLSRHETSARFSAIEAFADIGDFVDQPVKTYSSGMLVRLAFAVIAHVDADILVIDEALSVGDVFFVQKCMRFLRGFMERGTVLFVSHDTSAVLNLCETALWLHGGQVEAQGLPRTVTEKYLERLYESQQGPSVTLAQTGPVSNPAGKTSTLDALEDSAKQSGHRNAIELFSFDPNGAEFGKRGIAIRAVGLFDAAGNPLSWAAGGDAVSLKIQCSAVQPTFSPIVGFLVKDRLGQVIFADNTYVAYAHRPLTLAAGDEIEARFDFVMPVMQQGDYVVAAAVAEGTQAEHIQHHWMHEAMAFKVHSSVVCHGLIGITMTHIELQKS